MYNYGNIEIANINNHTYRAIGQYTNNLYTCDIMLKTEPQHILLAKYECSYTLKKDSSRLYIEQPKYDINAKLLCTAPEEWSICMVTELFPTKNVVLQATFNVYRQEYRLSNKRYYDTKIVKII